MHSHRKFNAQLRERSILKLPQGPTYKIRIIVLMRFFLHLSVSFDAEMLSGLLVVEYSALLSEMSPPE